MEQEVPEEEARQQSAMEEELENNQPAATDDILSGGLPYPESLHLAPLEEDSHNNNDEAKIDQAPPPTVQTTKNTASSTSGSASTTASTTASTKHKRKQPPPPKATRGKFEERFTELEQFQKEHGHCRVPHKYIPNLKLGYFVSNIRKFYRNKQNGQPSTLSEAQIQKLEALGFEWNLHGPLTDFNKRIQGLNEFYQRHGHIRIPATRYVKPLTEKEPNPHWQLGSFISDMRKEYKLYQQGKPSRLNSERIQALEDVGMEWVAKHSQTFEDYVQELKGFFEKHGHFRVSNNSSGSKQENEASDTLKQWVHRVRAMYSKLKQGGRDSDAFLTPERIQALDAIGFDWANDSDHVWNQRYNELKEFHTTHGHCRVPSGRGRPKAGTSDPLLALAGWIGKQREHYRYLAQQHPEAMQKNEDGTTKIVWPKDMKRYMSLTTERIKKLEELGFEWQIRSAVPTFEERLESLREHKEKFGHVNVRQDRDDDNQYKKLVKMNQLTTIGAAGRWLAELRLEYLKGKSTRLTPERMKALGDLGINWKDEGKAKKQPKSYTRKRKSGNSKKSVNDNNGDKEGETVANGTKTTDIKGKEGRRFDQLLKVAAKEKSSADSCTTSPKENHDDDAKPVTVRRSSPRKLANEDATAGKATGKRKNTEPPIEADEPEKRVKSTGDEPAQTGRRRSQRSISSVKKEKTGT